MPRSELLYIQDILHSIEKIEKYVSQVSYDEFLADDMRIDAIITHFAIIGEASRNLSENFKEGFPELPWVQIISMRNKLMHEYFGIDPMILWETIATKLPELKTILQKKLQADT